MSKIKSLAIKGTAGLASIMALASSALAYSYEYSYGDDAAFASLGAAYWIFMCCIGLFSLIVLVFWVWMLIDLLKRTEAEVPNKVMWIVLMLLLTPSCFVYFFVVKRKLDAKK